MSDVSAALKRIRDARPKPLPRPGEQCELCSEAIPDDHNHIVDLDTRSLMCACRGCFLVFSPDGAGGKRFRAVPDRYLAFPGVGADASWDAFDIPVGLAFFFLNSTAGTSTTGQLAAFYPGPAGATESMLPLDAWHDITTAHPELATMRPDVEALLVHTSKSTRALARPDDSPECFVVPIDACYELVGELRRVWRGFDGGSEAHAAIRRFFDRVRQRAAVGVEA